MQISSVGGLRKLQEKVFSVTKWKNITPWSKIIPRIIKFVSKNMLPADLNNAAEHQVIPMGPEKYYSLFELFCYFYTGREEL